MCVYVYAYAYACIYIHICLSHTYTQLMRTQHATDIPLTHRYIYIYRDRLTDTVSVSVSMSFCKLCPHPCMFYSSCTINICVPVLKLFLRSLFLSKYPSGPSIPPEGLPKLLSGDGPI